MCPACDPRQNAWAFNQPLSWDTSRVTDMLRTLQVRCLSAYRPPICTQSHPLSPLHAACTPCTPAASRLLARSPPRTPHDSRQEARAFNQPLSWDTSAVTDMSLMFHVRSSPRPAPQSAVAPAPLHAACMPRSLAASCLPARSPPCTPRAPSLRPSAGRENLRPAAQLGHLSCHKHGKNVSSTLLPSTSPCHAPQSAVAGALSPARVH